MTLFVGGCGVRDGVLLTTIVSFGVMAVPFIIIPDIGVGEVTLSDRFMTGASCDTTLFETVFVGGL